MTSGSRRGVGVGSNADRTYALDYDVKELFDRVSRRVCRLSMSATMVPAWSRRGWRVDTHRSLLKRFQCLVPWRGGASMDSGRRSAATCWENEMLTLLARADRSPSCSRLVGALSGRWDDRDCWPATWFTPRHRSRVDCLYVVPALVWRKTSGTVALSAAGVYFRAPWTELRVSHNVCTRRWWSLNDWAWSAVCHRLTVTVQSSFRSILPSITQQEARQLLLGRLHQRENAVSDKGGLTRPWLWSFSDSNSVM